MATALLWRPFPVLTLTVRQFLGGKAVRVVVVLSLIPCLFAGIWLLGPQDGSRREFLVELFENLVVPTLLPITTLILATAALGNEVEDRTLPYLVLKPVARARIAWEKLLGVLVVALPAILAGVALAYLIVAAGGEDNLRFGDPVPPDLSLPPVLWAMLGAGAAGIIALAAIFLFVSLVIPRALLVGIVYALVWESLLGRFLPGVRVVSVRHYVQSIFVALLDDPTVTLANATSLRASLIALGAASLVALLLTTWRLRRMNLE
jgi:ABC-2 type transport system permease protein